MYSPLFAYTILFFCRLTAHKPVKEKIDILFRNECRKRTKYMKRDEPKYEKRPTKMRKSQFMWKETCKRDIKTMQRDQLKNFFPQRKYVKKEIFLMDLNLEKRPFDILALKTSEWSFSHVRRTTHWFLAQVCQKRPIYIQKDFEKRPGYPGFQVSFHIYIFFPSLFSYR